MFCILPPKKDSSTSTAPPSFPPSLVPRSYPCHCQSQPMQHKPCGLLSDSQSTANLMTTDSVFAVGQHPHCWHPLLQGDRRILENSSQLDGELTTAFAAFPALLSLEVVRLFSEAAGGLRALRPA